MLNLLKEYYYPIENYIATGGIVMIPLLLVSFFMWFLIINRMLFMRQLFFKNMSRTHAAKLIQSNKEPEKKYKGVMALLVKKFLELRTGNPRTDAYILDETVMNLVILMDKHLSLISVLAALAPLLGLLGTVTGMIETFDVITVFGTGNSKALAGGISEALITTQTGLLISIPGLYMSGFLNKRAENLKYRIASAGMYLKRYL